MTTMWHQGNDVIRLTGSSVHLKHYNDVIMSAITSQITSLTIVHSTVYSDADQRKHQSFASLAFVLGIHRAVNVSIWWRHHDLGHLLGYWEMHPRATATQSQRYFCTCHDSMTALVECTVSFGWIILKLTIMVWLKSSLKPLIRRVCETASSQQL